MTARLNNGTFRTGDYLSVAEDYAAVGSKLLFPRIQTCQAIICAWPTGPLSGCHLTVYSTKDDVDGCLAMIKTGSGAPSAIYAIGTYGMGSILGTTPPKNGLTSWAAAGESRVQWPKLTKTLGKEFGKCPIYVFDKGQNFVHIKATNTGGGRAILEYRLQQQNEVPTATDDFVYLHPKDLVPY